MMCPRSGIATDDLPGRHWRGRPSIDVAPGIYLAGDAVAAPGLLSEMAFESGRCAGALAATGGS